MARSNDLTNLLRRLRRHNKRNPSFALNVEADNIRDSARSIMSVASKLDKAQKVAKINAKNVALAHRANVEKYQSNIIEALDHGAKLINANVRRTEQSALREQARIEKHLNKAAAFNQQQKEYIERSISYNAKLKGDHSKRLVYVPRTPAELEKFNKAITLLEQGNEAEARKLLRISKKKDFRKTLSQRDDKSAKKSGVFSYSDRVYYRNVMTHGGDSPVPELLELFREGGESIVLELSAAGFTMLEYYQVDARVDGGMMLRQLEETIPQLNARNRMLVKDFIDKYKSKYA